METLVPTIEQLICDEEGEEPMEIPLEDDCSLSLSTLTAQFPGACGLKYRHPETQSLRGVRLVEEKFLPPEEGWNYVFICNFPKENKRKIDDHVETSMSKKRMESSKCVDLIVLGLPWKSTEKDLEQYFESFGELVMTQIKKDSQTGKSKGFGFIRFSSYESQRRVLLQRHSIGGRNCDVRIPNSKEGNVPSHNGKIYISRLDESLTKTDLETYFSEFGKVIDCYVPNPFRGFAFVTFCDPEVADLIHENHVINGNTVHVSLAFPKNDSGDRNGGGNRNKFHRNDRGNKSVWDNNSSGGPWDNNSSGGPWENNSGGSWNNSGNWGYDSGNSNANMMDWNNMSASAAMPLMAALSQASMQIMETMQNGGMMGGGASGGYGNNSRGYQGSGTDYGNDGSRSGRSGDRGDGWKRSNYDRSRGGRRQSYDR